MDDDSSPDAVLDDDDPGQEVEGEDVTEDGSELAELDPDEQDASVTPASSEAAAPEAPSAAAVPTVLDRMRSAGINEATARRHLESGWVRLDARVVTDPEQAAAPPSRVVIWPPVADSADG